MLIVRAPDGASLTQFSADAVANADIILHVSEKGEYNVVKCRWAPAHAMAIQVLTDESLFGE